MMLGSPCSPCCEKECLVAFELQDVETLPFTKCIWHPSAFNGVFAQRIVINGVEGLECLSNFNTWGCSGRGIGVIPPNGELGLLEWPGPVRIELKQAATSFSPSVPAIDTVESVILEIRPQQNFDASAPAWDVYEIDGNNEILRPTVVGRLFRESDDLPQITVFDPPEDYPIVYRSAFNGFYHDITDPNLGLGEYDFTFSFSASLDAPPPGLSTRSQNIYNGFSSRVARFIADTNRTFTLGPINVTGLYGGGADKIVLGGPQYRFSACGTSYITSQISITPFATPLYNILYNIDMFPDVSQAGVFGGPAGFLRGIQRIAQVSLRGSFATGGLGDGTPRFQVNNPKSASGWEFYFFYPTSDTRDTEVLASDVAVDERGYLVNATLPLNYERPIRSTLTYTVPGTNTLSHFTGTMTLNSISVARQ